MVVDVSESKAPKEHDKKETGSLSARITRQLLFDITEGCYSSEKRLPPEVVMARELGVSRNLLRDCLSAMEREGFISRRRGVGTIINRHVLNVAVRLDLEEEFLDMVTHSGHTAGVAFVNIDYVEATEVVAKHFEIPEGTRMFRAIRLITANGKPAIYCEDYVPATLIKEDLYVPKDSNAPIFTFLEEACHTEVYMDLTEIRPVVATEQLSQLLAVPLGAPLLYMDEVGYDFFGCPILNSKEYYADGIMQHMVLRKKI